MANEGYEVPLTSVGAKMAFNRKLAGANPYTTRIIDNTLPINDRMIDERIADHIHVQTSSGFSGNMA